MKDVSPSAIFNGRNVFLMGGTGFLGKVCLSMLLYRFPSIGRVYVMVRAGSGTDSQTRFVRDVVESPPFDPLRERYGGALMSFLADKVVIVGGDITEPHLGYGEELAQKIADDIDVIINSSGKVTFDPPLDQSLRTNVNGTEHVIAFAKRMKRPALVHVSTCFVAGNRSGEIWEDEPLVGFFPRNQEMEGVTFSVEAELDACAKLAARVQEEAKDPLAEAEFLSSARKRLREEGRDPDNEQYLKLAQARERKNWVRARLTELGMKRAQGWGWPNIYCYTKSMGDQLVAQETGIVRAIVRPSVVESAVAYPFPGWNEGFTTTAPLIFLALKGQSAFPVSEELILDLIPVDYVAAGVIAVAALACVEQPKLVYQFSSGDTNPLMMRRVITLLGLHKREQFQQKADEETHPFRSAIDELIGRMETKSVELETFSRFSAPMIQRASRKTHELLEKVRPRWGAKRVADWVDVVKDHVGRIESVTKEIDHAFALYRPFTTENHYIFRTDSIRALYQRMPVEDRRLLPWEIATLDWHDYWIQIHFPGLHKWVFPELEKDFATRPKAVFTYKHLLELFETSTKLHAHRTAMVIERDGYCDRYTYADLQELAGRVAGFLVEQGVQSGDRVMVLSKNCPEWSMCYFGVIKAGATCVPLDADLSTQELLNLANTGRVRALLLHDDLVEKHPDLLAEHREFSIWRFSQVFELVSLDEETKRLEALPKRIASDSVASLIFTSGTTGSPKGVMLTHRNFTNMVSELASVFSVTPNDGLLSVLPLHHTFEFSAGLLLPLAQGSHIAYLSELNGDTLSRALKQGKTTTVIGVPALWELLKRRIQTRISDGVRGWTWVEQAFDLLIKTNSWVRNHSPFNVGIVLFAPIHQQLGGRIRYFVSGGSALAEHVARYFHGLGLTLLEGYGLTEASPVITVNRPNNALLVGSVGQALPHVEVKIVDANEQGVGEIVARGNTIMTGYFENKVATEQTIRDNWLYTGDLGRIDDEKNLYIVGRSKEIIVESTGKNIYPDELEELYGNSPWIKELSVVGLPDGSTERIACLVVPHYDRDALTREEIEERIRDHFRTLSTTLPFYKRIKLLQFTDRELPRTATRKVKRREVVALLQGLLSAENVSSIMSAAPPSKSEWLYEIVAHVCGVPRAQLSADTHLNRLGFDSLMYTELGTAIESAGGYYGSMDDLMGFSTMRELAGAVRRSTKATEVDDAAIVESSMDAGKQRHDIVNVPEPLALAGRTLLSKGQKLLYDTLLDAKFFGQSHIPFHTNFIVAANHCSHLDTGLVKVALGEAGDDLCALAASDYFFDTKLKRTYFENFTNLIPMDRTGSLRKSLRSAEEVLKQGYSLLIFPEGTRSTTGQLQEFKASLGYLALHAQVGILPLYLWGTYEALPKGSALLKSRDVGVAIDAFISYDELKTVSQEIPRHEAYRRIAELIHARVAKLQQMYAPSERRAVCCDEPERHENVDASVVEVAHGA